jgi:hypothetical protein
MVKVKYHFERTFVQRLEKRRWDLNHVVVKERRFYDKTNMVVQACNLSTREAEARGLRVQGWPELQNKILSKKEREFYRNKT